MTAGQVLPAREFATPRVRMAEGVTLDVQRFSLEPHRLLELLWPNPFGTLCPENRTWLQAILPTIDRAPWVSSLYTGGLILILAASATGLRGSSAWQAWLTVIALVALAVSLGRFASPLWWARWLPISGIGPHDPANLEWRGDAYLDDSTGSTSTRSWPCALAPGIPGVSLSRSSS